MVAFDVHHAALVIAEHMAAPAPQPSASREEPFQLYRLCTDCDGTGYVFIGEDEEDNCATCGTSAEELRLPVGPSRDARDAMRPCGRFASFWHRRWRRYDIRLIVPAIRAASAGHYRGAAVHAFALFVSQDGQEHWRCECGSDELIATTVALGKEPSR
jgi:hypothetical protein